MPTYHDRFDASRHYDRHLFLPEHALQAAELNELQSSAHDRLKRIADALFADGDILSGADVAVDPATGEARCGAGAIYLRGAARGVTPRTITVPIEGTVSLGVYLQTSYITELDDPGLRDPAVAVRNTQEPGAHRLKIEPVWGFAGDGQSGDFFAVHSIVDGVLISKAPPPNVDAMAQYVARYDRQSSGGYYVANGMYVSRLADANGAQVYSISEGEARVNGSEVIRRHARRVVHPAVPDLRAVPAEPHLALGGTEVVTLDHGPVWAIDTVTCTKQEAVLITRGPAAGGADLLPRSPVVEIVSVTQGTTTFNAGTDFTRVGGQVDWSPGGSEPAPGSTYLVSYRYIASVQPINPTATGLTVQGAVAGTLIQVSYQWALPRFDRVAINELGDPVVVSGASAARAPRIPALPSGLLGLAVIEQRWSDSTRVVNNGTRMVPMDELNAVNRRIDTLFALVAEERLALNLTIADPSTKRGVFVDPFLDDDLRDQGLAQDAAIFSGELTLAIDPTVHAQTLGAVQMLDARVITETEILVGPDEVIIEQTARTGTMLVNPYDSFSPMPGVATLSPSVDYWTEFETQWLSPVTRQFREDRWTNPAQRNTWLGLFDSQNWAAFGEWSGVVSQLSRDEFISEHTLVVSSTQTREVETERVGARYVDAQTLRPITVRFDIAGFGPGEELRAVTFDGRQVAVQEVAP